MATIIFSAVGLALGGPIGSAIGTVLGQQVDQRILGGKGAQGPRLSDLKIQTSSYATPIPKVFGTMRLSGPVIWATDLKEDRRKQSNGKGQPKTTVYSYSASFAVALSARRAARVGRIWADGKLLRGAAGDFKTATGFRFFAGTEGQQIDPLIAATEGISATPAYRGLCYAVFEDFQLADYGNRIPSLSFEIIGDEGGTTLSAVMEDIAPRDVTANCPTQLGGFAAYGDSVRAVYQSLSAVVPVLVRDDGSGIHISEAFSTPVVIPDPALGATNAGRTVARIAVDQQSSSKAPSRLSLTYADPSRDFQNGMQHARREGGARREEVLELAAALTADAARMLAERQIAKRWSSRKSARVTLPWRYGQLSPGMTVQVQGQPDVWAVVSTSLERMVLSLTLERVLSSGLVGMPATSGRSVREADQPHGPTVLRILDLPPLEDGVRTSPFVVACATGTSPGWKSAALLQSIDDGASWQEVGPTAAPAILGNLASALAVGTTGMYDMINSVDVVLAHSKMELNTVEDPALLSGQNLAVVGSELIQFGKAELISAGRYRLSRLLRGIRATAPIAHAAGTSFTLVEREALLPLDVPVGTSSVRLLAAGVGDPVAGIETAINVSGLSISPPAPVHVVATKTSNGDIRVSWKRRSRDGWRWIDGVDAPLAEETERYRVVTHTNNGIGAIYEVSSAEWIYPNLSRLADVASGAISMSILVSQLGTFAASPPVQISVILN